MVFLFYVVEEKNEARVLLQARRNLQRGKKVSKSFDKDRADILAANDRGSYFEQEKLISQDEEEQSSKL